MMPFIHNSRKFMLIFSARKLISGCLGMGVRKIGQVVARDYQNESTQTIKWRKNILFN